MAAVTTYDTDYARAACGLQYKMDYTKIKEANITMCNQLYFALNQ